jgi:hypothetical protein
MVGEEWSPLVVSKSKDDESFVFARTNGDLLRLLVVADDGEDLTVVQVDVDQDKVDEFIRDR